MKKSKIILPVMTFIVGIVIGVIPLALMSFTRSSDTGTPQRGLTLVSATEANAVLKNYLKTATTPTEPIKGFLLDTLQLSAMKLIAKENKTLVGFRIYLGKGINNIPVSIVVGVDNKGADATGNTIYKTSSLKSGPCPLICDVSSTISKD